MSDGVKLVGDTVPDSPPQGNTTSSGVSNLRPEECRDTDPFASQLSSKTPGLRHSNKGVWVGFIQHTALLKHYVQLVTGFV